MDKCKECNGSLLDCGDVNEIQNYQCNDCGYLYSVFPNGDWVALTPEGTPDYDSFTVLE